MPIILNECTKFKKVGRASTCGNTSKTETNTQRWLLSVYKSNLISKMCITELDVLVLNGQDCMDYPKFFSDLFYQ